MESPPLAPGTRVTCSKTVSESDVYLFAGLTGDLSPNHVDETFMQKSAYGRRVAHGALIVGYMSRASSLVIERAPPPPAGYTPVSVGYDKVRFLKPVFIGDTITIAYQIERIEPARHRTIARVEATNQRSELVAVADHIMQWVQA